MQYSELRPFDRENCIFKNECSLYNTPDCKDPCWRQREYFYLLDNSNLSERHKTDIRLIPSEEDLPVFEYLDYIRQNIFEFVDAGKNLLITGASGCSKTTWAAKLVRQYISDICIGNGFKPRVAFLNMTWYVRELRNSISEKNEYFSNLRKAATKLELVVMDDIGAASVDNNFIHDELYTLINARVDSGLSTIYTTNLSNKELAKQLGTRIASRITGTSEIVHISNTTDLRRPDDIFSFDRFVQELKSQGKY